MNRWVKITLIVVLGVILLIGGAVTAVILSYQSLPEYNWTANNDVERGGVLYRADPDLLQQYQNGELKEGGIVGRFAGDSIIGGFNVRRIGTLDPNEAFLVRGLMFDDVFSRVEGK